MTTQLQRDRKRIEDTRDTTAKTVATCSPGDCWDQGDLRIMFVGTQKPEVCGEQILPLPRQLAPGNTKGSRHGLLGKDIRAYKRTDSDSLKGPLLRCPAGLTVPHPEHGDVTFCESGWYAVTYQRAYAEELRRQQD